MKKYSLLILSFLTVHIGQAQDTLRHFDPQNQTPTVMQYSAPRSGYYTGHNSVFDEEWGEKYYISNTNQVTGVIAYHTGTNGSYNANCEYKVYSVGSNGLPGSELGKKAVSGASLDISGKAVFTAFASPINVKDSFIITFNLGDYAHHSPGTKKIALMHGPDGSRSNSDTTVFGRNVIRWHNHTPTWKGFYKENNTKIRTHFAIFPVLSMKNTSVNDFASNGVLKMYSLYPNPAVNKLQMKVKSTRAIPVRCSIIDMRGSVVKSWEKELTTSTNTIDVDVAGLPTGQYVLLIGSNGSGQLAQTFMKQ